MSYDSAKRLFSLTSQAGTFTYTYLNVVCRSTTPSRLVKKLLLPNTNYLTNTYDTVARELSTKLNKSDRTIVWARSKTARSAAWFAYRINHLAWAGRLQATMIHRNYVPTPSCPGTSVAFNFAVRT